MAWINCLRNDPLQSRAGGKTAQVGKDDCVHHPSLSRQAVQHIRHGRRGETGQRRLPTAHLSEQEAEQDGLPECCSYSDDKERETIRTRAPSESKCREENP